MSNENTNEVSEMTQFDNDVRVMTVQQYNTYPAQYRKCVRQGRHVQGYYACLAGKWFKVRFGK